MASGNSILKLRVESEEYDAKLKKAAEGLRHLAEVAHKSGGELTGLEKSELDYIRALGDMETKSRTAVGSTRELENAFKELTVIYNQLNEAEKSDEGGKAIAASLEKLKQRAIDAKSGLNEATQALQGNTQASSSDMKGIEGLTSALGLNITKLAGWGVALGATNTAMEVVKDAFFANETQLDEWGRTVQSTESLYNGFLNALNTGDISGYLNRMDEIVNTARDAYDAMDTLATYNSFTRGARAGLRSKYSEALVEYKLNPTEENKKALDEANKALVDGLQQQAGLIKQNYEKALKSLGINRLLQGESLNEFMDLFRSGDWDKLETMKAGYSQGKMLNAGSQYWYGDRVYDGKIQDRFTGKWHVMDADEKKQFEFARVLSQVNDKQIDAIQAIDEQYKNTLDAINNQNRSYNRLAGNNAPTHTPKTDKQRAADIVAEAERTYADTVTKAAIRLQSGMDTQVEYEKKQLSAQEQLYSSYSKAYAIYADPKYKTAQDAAAAEILKLGGEVKKSTDAQEAQKKAARELEQAQKKAAEEAKKRSALMESWKTASTGAMESLKKDLLKRQGTTAVGSAEFNALQANIVDVSNLQTLINNALKNGLTIDPKIPNMLMQQIVGGKDIDNKVWENLQRQLNDRLKEMNLDPLNLNFNTGEGKTGKKSDLMGDSKKVIGGLSQVASGLQQMGVELPKEVQQVIGVIQGVMSVIEGINTVISITQTTALTANTAAMVALTTALWANTGVSAIPFFARGGIVPHAANGYFVGGNSFSGDTTPILANAGELVLNKSSQNNLASMITEAESRGRGGNGLARVSGEQIWIALNAYTKRTGQGELVTWK